MSTPELPCEALTADGVRRSLPPTEVPRAVRNGAIVQCRGLLQAIGWAQRLDDAMREAVRSCAGEAAVPRLRTLRCEERDGRVRVSR